MSEVSKAVGQWIVDNVGWTVVILLFVLSGIFKIAKIELDPVGAVIGWFGKKLTKSVRDDVADLKKDTDSKIADLRTDLDALEEGTTSNCDKLSRHLNELEKSNDMQTIRQIKVHVLDFANSCMNHGKHTKKDFDNIIDENTQYEQLVKKYNLQNDVYKEDFAYIMKTYHYCQDNNAFLQEGTIGATH